MLSVQNIKELLDYIHNDLGLVDTYNSDKAYVENNTRAVTPNNPNVEAFGLHYKLPKPAQAILVKGPAQFQGPAGSPQIIEEDAIIVKAGESTRVVQTSIFLETYENTDGSPIDLSTIPVTDPNNDALKKSSLSKDMRGR